MLKMSSSIDPSNNTAQFPNKYNGIDGGSMKWFKKLSKS